MQVWADVYNSTGVKVAVIDQLVSAGATRRLDQAGTFDLQCALDEDVITHLVTGNEVALYVQEDSELPLEWVRGKILKPKVQENAGALQISIGGRDLLDELRYRTVGLGRTYSATAVESILDDLLSLTDDWTLVISSSAGSQLQTARFDGAKILKAIVRTVEELGLHFRLGEGTRTLEVGAFGEAATVTGSAYNEPIWAMQAPSSITPELYSNDAVLIIDDISVQEDADNIINWAIPMGAGEGVAATTLKDTTYRILNTDNSIYRAGTTPDYPIYRRVNSARIIEYYVDASNGGERREETLSFKEIGPVANSITAKQLASNALAKATFESLRRSRVANRSLNISVKKARVDLRPGDLLHVRYKGVVEMTGNPRATQPTLTYIDVDEDLWVMAVQRNITTSGINTVITVNTVDQHIKDETDIMVEVLERSEVNNLSLQAFPFGFQDSSERVIQGNTSSAVPPYKEANFGLKIPDLFTEVIKIEMTVLTRPLYTLTDVGPDNFLGSGLQALDYSYVVYEGTNYPSDITLFIDGVDRTSALGGPWNPSAGNSPVNVTLDITDYIIDAAGGLYQDHTLVFKAGYKTAEGRVSTAHNSQNVVASHGIIEAKILFLGIARAVLPD
jgi:hypothetical protein